MGVGGCLGRGYPKVQACWTRLPLELGIVWPSQKYLPGRRSEILILIADSDRGKEKKEGRNAQETAGPMARPETQLPPTIHTLQSTRCPRQEEKERR